MSITKDDLDDESWDIRETFAYFGRAFYMASVLEVGLAHALLLGEFLVEVRDKIVASKGKGFDRKQYEADFDSFMDKQFALTMGNIIRRVEKLPDFDEDLRKRIVAAKDRRDFLTHHYWRERSVKFAAPEGRKQMRDELNEDAEAFGRLDQDIQAAMKPTREKLGIDDKVLEAYFERMKEEIKFGSPPDM
jgi:hypothetical protein